MPETAAHAATALIAEDESLLAEALRAELLAQWPQLDVLAIAPDGDAALQQALALKPDVLFLDIRMPGRSGLEAAQAIVEDWPEDRPLPLIVYVTAYDQYALQAFETAAADYLLKPVQPQRLAATCRRLQATLAQRVSSPGPHGAALDDLLAPLRALLARPDPGGPVSHAPQGRLQVIQGGAGNTVHLVPVAQVIYFESADKYVRVVSQERELLIRQSMRDLIPQLDPTMFWQVHRGTVVRADAIDTATRDDTGRITLKLRGRPEKLAVSRLYAHLFRAM